MPLPLDHMLLRPVRRAHRRLERVRLAGEVALAFVLDLRTWKDQRVVGAGAGMRGGNGHRKTQNEARECVDVCGRVKERKQTHRAQPPTRTRDPTRLRKLNIRTPVPQPVDPQPRQRDHVLLLLPIREADRERRVADLLHDNGPACGTCERQAMKVNDAGLWNSRDGRGQQMRGEQDGREHGTRTRKTSLLRIMSLQREPLARVLDVVRRDGRMVRHLLDDEVRLPATVLFWPVAVEDSAEGVV